MNFNNNHSSKVNGLKSVQEIPLPYGRIFQEFTHFNKVQSRVFNDVFYTNKSAVISAPTGSGKTVILELAIVNLLLQYKQQDSSEITNAKIVYIAPLKSLCSERYLDWSKKFSNFGLNCQEITGDSDIQDTVELRNANLIITTPEKWDSLTRRWKDNEDLVTAIKLFLIDEVHLLNEDVRGPILEAIVSRMKTIHMTLMKKSRNKEPNIKLRFLAVSATIPNIEDLADWLKITSEENIAIYRIDEEERPVKLQRVVLGINSSLNGFKFDMNLNYKLSQIIKRYSNGKPTLIFCSSRKAVEMAASVLIKDYPLIPLRDNQKLVLFKLSKRLQDHKLQNFIMKSIAYHHGGLGFEDRSIIEDAFRKSLIQILVSTNTLAMGVNLPAHLVIIKSTEMFVAGSVVEYSESAILQMIGRAGRPQFDKTGVAVIMTQQKNVKRYENLVNGSVAVESHLHKHLTEHLNSEIVLQTITNLEVAMDWIRSTFLYVRAVKCPKNYGFPPGMTRKSIEKNLEGMCLVQINALEQNGLILKDEKNGVSVWATQLGKLMARYYVPFVTMKHFKTIKGNETLLEIFNIIIRCHEFSEFTLRVSDKKVLNDINNSPVRFPIKGKIKTREDKISCLIQATFGNVTIQDPSLIQDSLKVIRLGEKIAKCLLEYLKLLIKPSENKLFKALLHSAIIAKCFKAKLWENSEFTSKQLKKIGAVYSNLLVKAGKKNLQSLLNTNPRVFEMILNKSPPFGDEILEILQKFPEYSLQLIRKTKDTGEIVINQINKNYQCSGDYCILIVGDTNNNLIYYNDKVNTTITKQGTFRKTFMIPELSVEAIHLHLIHDSIVGIDKHCTLILNLSENSELTKNGSHVVKANHQTKKNAKPSQKLKIKKPNPKENKVSGNQNHVQENFKNLLEDGENFIDLCTPQSGLYSSTSKRSKLPTPEPNTKGRDNLPDSLSYSQILENFDEENHLKQMECTTSSIPDFVLSNNPLADPLIASKEKIEKWFEKDFESFQIENIDISDFIDENNDHQFEEKNPVTPPKNCYSSNPKNLIKHKTRKETDHHNEIICIGTQEYNRNTKKDDIQQESSLAPKNTHVEDRCRMSSQIEKISDHRKPMQSPKQNMFSEVVGSHSESDIGDENKYHYTSNFIQPQNVSPPRKVYKSKLCENEKNYLQNFNITTQFHQAIESFNTTNFFNNEFRIENVNYNRNLSFFDNSKSGFIHPDESRNQNVKKICLHMSSYVIYDDDRRNLNIEIAEKPPDLKNEKLKSYTNVKMISNNLIGVEKERLPPEQEQRKTQTFKNSQTKQDPVCSERFQINNPFKSSGGNEKFESTKIKNESHYEAGRQILSNVRRENPNENEDESFYESEELKTIEHQVRIELHRENLKENVSPEYLEKAEEQHFFRTSTPVAFEETDKEKCSESRNANGEIYDNHRNVLNKIQYENEINRIVNLPEDKNHILDVEEHPRSKDLFVPVPQTCSPLSSSPVIPSAYSIQLSDHQSFNSFSDLNSKDSGNASLLPTQEFGEIANNSDIVFNIPEEPQNEIDISDQNQNQFRSNSKRNDTRRFQEDKDSSIFDKNILNELLKITANHPIPDNSVYSSEWNGQARKTFNDINKPEASFFDSHQENFFDCRNFNGLAGEVNTDNTEEIDVEQDKFEIPFLQNQISEKAIKSKCAIWPPNMFHPVVKMKNYAFSTRKRSLADIFNKNTKSTEQVSIIEHNAAEKFPECNVSNQFFRKPNDDLWNFQNGKKMKTGKDLTNEYENRNVFSTSKASDEHSKFIKPALDTRNSSELLKVLHTFCDNRSSNLLDTTVNNLKGFDRKSREQSSHDINEFSTNNFFADYLLKRKYPSLENLSSLSNTNNPKSDAILRFPDFPETTSTTAYFEKENYSSQVVKNEGKPTQTFQRKKTFNIPIEHEKTFEFNDFNYDPRKHQIQENFKFKKLKMNRNENFGFPITNEVKDSLKINPIFHKPFIHKNDKPLGRKIPKNGYQFRY